MFTRRLAQRVAIGFWVALLGVAAWVWFASGIALQDVPTLLEQWLKPIGIPAAALLYVALYTVRPLVFFPGTVLTLAAGLVFGPWLGVALTILGANLSANVAFLVARSVGRSYVSHHESVFARTWDVRLSEHGFLTVFIMRLLFLPFDAVNYGAGLTAMRQRDFALGTFLGTLPGSATFVLLGSSASSQLGGEVHVLGLALSGRAFTLLLSLAFFVVGLLIAWLLRRLSRTAREIHHAHHARD